jgi:hypothetical protein
MEILQYIFVVDQTVCLCLGNQSSKDVRRSEAAIISIKVGNNHLKKPASFWKLSGLLLGSSFLTTTSIGSKQFKLTKCFRKASFSCSKADASKASPERPTSYVGA